MMQNQRGKTNLMGKFYKIMITTCDDSLFSKNKENKENFDFARKKQYDNYK